MSPMEIRETALSTFFDFFRKNQDKRVLVLYGGAGSGKSYSTAQWLCSQLISRPNLRILCIRKTLPSLRMTALLLVLDTLNRWGVPYELNKSELTIRYGSSVMFFKGLDDPEKIKSFEANLIWIEEATELTKEDFLHLDLRTRRAGGNQIILTFNPIDAFHWTITDLVQKPDPTVAVHHSTYKDNPFLPRSYIKTLESLTEKDYNFYRIYTLGEPGVLENIIYSHYRIEDPRTWPDRTNGPPTRLGIDFGYNDPTVVVSLHVIDKEHYVRELLYRTHMTNSDLVAFLHDLIKKNDWPRDIEVICDSAEPNRIEELARAGINARPAMKDIKYGIDAVRSRPLHIDHSAINGIKELRGYSYKKDKDGRVLDTPVDAFNHFCDAVRYAIATGYDQPPSTSRLMKMIVR